MSRKKSPFPDGTNPGKYKNWRNWSYRRWAWEFLRRNPSYITACKKSKRGSAQEQAQVAERFGLKVFKDYRELYRGDSGIPKFQLGSVWLKPNLDLHEGHPTKKMQISYGQVGIKFTLSDALIDKAVLEKQLRIARLELLRRLDEFKAATNPSARPIGFRPSLFLEYIRILDCRRAGLKRHEIARMLLPHMADTDQDTLIEIIKPKIKAAVEHATRKYRFLSVRSGKPTTKNTDSEN